jgi:hypothetical protein
MGGPGSGNRYHWWRSKKDTVEGCRQLDANRWARERLFKAGAHRFGEWSWYYGDEKEPRSSISYEVNTVDAVPWVRLFYTLTASQEKLDYRVRLATTQPHFGGLRWWFCCPLSVHGVACGRRVGKLYLHGRYFGCRHCHGLTYRSVQEHDKRVDLLRRNPEALWALVESPGSASVGQLLLALRALRCAAHPHE